VPQTPSGERLPAEPGAWTESSGSGSRIQAIEEGTEPFAYFAGFFAVCFFGGLDWTVFPGGTHPHPQFSFLANRITSFPPGSRFLSL
jgi:hypothetical protein